MKTWILSLAVLAGTALAQPTVAAPPIVELDLAAANVAALGGVASISSGANHTCVVTAAGAAKCWGANNHGQLGDNSTTDRLIPTDVFGLGSGVKEIAAGAAHTCALMVAGAVKCWGYNSDYGQVGDGSAKDRLAPVDVPGLASGVVAISAGGINTCAVTNGDGLKCWGSNGYGQLGLTDRPPHSFPSAVPSFPSGVQAVTVGLGYVCVLTVAGGVKCWGNNYWGTLGNGDTDGRSQTNPVDVVGLESGVASIAAGFKRSCAVKTDGRAFCWGDQDFDFRSERPSASAFLPSEVAFSGPVVALANGQNHLCALSASGAVECEGENISGQLGDGTSSSYIIRRVPMGVVGMSSGVAAIAAGVAHTCALGVDGGVKCWGTQSAGAVGNNLDAIRRVAVDVASFDGQASAVATGFAHACGITVYGGLKCWGEGSSGQIGVGSQLESNPNAVGVVGLGSGVAAVTAGGAHTCALTATGGAKCWGNGFFSQLGTGGGDTLTPQDVVGLNSGVAALAAGSRHTCALTTAGAIKCWGENKNGQLGNGATEPEKAPTEIKALPAPARAISTGRSHTCAVTVNDAAFCWGANSNGQLGNGQQADQTTPVTVVGLAADVKAISAGGDHTCALTTAGKVQCWGDGSWGQLGTGTGASSAVPVDVLDLGDGVLAVAAGKNHTCAVTAAGGVKCWGANNYGQLGYNTRISRAIPIDAVGLASGVVSISASGFHTCALTAEGKIKCWGDNYFGQSGDGTDALQRLPTAVLSVPVCALSATATTVSAGTPVTLAAACTPVPDSLAWGGVSFDGSTGGIVTPFFTTTYTAQGSNVIGVGNSSSVTVTATDSAILPGKRGDYTIAKSVGGISVADSTGASQTFAALKRLRFADMSIAFDLDGVAGQAYRLYQAAFNRVPDLQGLGYQMAAIEVSGLTLRQVAQNFIDSPEFSSVYGLLDDRQFVILLYANVLRRLPDAGGLAFYLDGFARGAFTRAQVLAGFSESPENQALVLSAIQNGIQYLPLYDGAGNGN